MLQKRDESQKRPSQGGPMRYIPPLFNTHKWREAPKKFFFRKIQAGVLENLASELETQAWD